MSKIFCDPVHGDISFHPLCVVIIDTPEFQRLRNLKQTGFSEYVYPGATQNRFCHSLGVCHLAGKFMHHLRNLQPELGITDADVLCVEIAGLCHDLGHGPLSHSWEMFVNEATDRKNNGKIKLSWKHERVSQNMFEHMVVKNNLKEVFSRYDLHEPEILLIKQLIVGEKISSNNASSKDKTFMYQIVNNDCSGLDVDKWDYFLRDCYHLGMPCNFEYQRLIKFSKVLMVDGLNQICFRDKLLENVYNVFRTRSNLHRRAYQHRVVKIYDSMFINAMCDIDGKCSNLRGEKLHFWEVSMAAAYSQGERLYKALDKYCLLTDCLVLNVLKYNNDPSLSTVTAFVAALEKRSSGLYRQVAVKISPVLLDKRDILQCMENYIPAATKKVLENHTPCLENGLKMVTVDQMDVCVTSIDWGKSEKNPVQFVHFYSKDLPICVKDINREESSVILPKAFQEIQIHVNCTRSDAHAIAVVKTCFDMYWQSLATKITHL